MKGVCEETRRRVQLTIWAYAYEIANDPMVDDATFDRIAREVDLREVTNRADLDAWWVLNFDPSTGMWIHQHPELDKAAARYHSLKLSWEIISKGDETAVEAARLV